MLSKNQLFRFPTSKILWIFISLIINLQYRITDAAVFHVPEKSNEIAEESCQNACTSCVKTAKFFKSIMNQNLDPCEDFYHFVCGNINNKSIHDEWNYIDKQATQNRISTILQEMVKQEVKPNDLGAVKKLKTYYRNCLNESRMEEEGTKRFLQLINNIGGWPVLIGKNWSKANFDWKETVYKIHRELKFFLTFPVTLTIDLDYENSKNMMLKVMPAAIHIDKTYFLDDSGEKRRNSYYKYMVNTAVALGADKDEILEEVKEILDFEVNLYNLKIKEPVEKLEKQIKMTLKELSQKYPSIPWLKLFNTVVNLSNISIDETQVVIVEDLEYIPKLEKLIEVTPKRVLANYLAWRTVKAVVKYMPRKFRVLESNFLNEVDKKNAERDSECVKRAITGFEIAVDAMYIRKYVNQTIKAEVTQVVQNIKNQTKKKLEMISWMDAKTRKAVVEKVEAIRVSIGYADELMDNEKVNGYYRDLEINPGSYLQADSNLSLFYQTKNFKYVYSKPFNISNWTAYQSASSINTYYIFQKNDLEIPAGVLQSLFHNDRPQYFKYATMGSIVGHQFTHSFDTTGRNFDKNGNAIKLWDSDTEERFLKKVQCMIPQYVNFTVEQVGLHESGAKPQDANIADNMGFTAAYQAYNEWTKSNNNIIECSRNLNYTSRQMYWISAASLWCSAVKSKQLTDKIISPFSNIPEFAEDFKCKPGSKMNPKEKCILW